ncbi:MAG: PDZ domain-containing protein [Eubacteriales bacterium]|nr:PDZ domain-containing protein [Eubacteriales bacterium]
MKFRTSNAIALIAVGLTAAFASSLLTSWLFYRDPFGLTLTSQSASETLDDTPTTTNLVPTMVEITVPTTATLETQPAPTLVDPSILGDAAKEQLAQLINGTLVQSLYERISPSVVGIRVTVESADSATPLTDRGSGLIYKADGLILTSTDVLGIAMNRYGELLENTIIQVQVASESEPFVAQLIGKDRLTGVAVLSIEPGLTKLQPAVFTYAPTLKVGQHVFFVSYPDDLIESGSMTSGLINALHEPIQLEDGTTVEMIRSDAPILTNGGGGPLINLAGEVIALSSSSQLTDTYDSLSYAMPSSAALSVADSLISQGFVAGRAWLGVAVLKDESFEELQALYHFPDGLYVSHVIEDSPAYIADIRRGDIITAVNDKAVDKHQSLASILTQHAAGDQINVTVYRRSNGKSLTLKVYLKEYVE